MIEFLVAEAYAAVRRPDVYLDLVVRSARHGRLARVSLPRTADEKFLWRKVFDRDPRLVVFCDKLASKEWVRDLGVDIAIPRVLWSGTDPDAIPFDLLTADTVLKANHGTGTNLFFDAGEPRRAEVLRLARQWLRLRHGRSTFEWGYYGVTPVLFVERRIRGRAMPLEDIKVYTFGPRIERVVRLRDAGSGRRDGQIWAPDEAGRLRNLDRKPGAADAKFDGPPPPSWDRAMHIASRIGEETDHARVDLLSDGETLWFGEITMYNQCGTLIWDNHDPDVRIARAWDLRRTLFLRCPPTRGWRARYAASLGAALGQDADAGLPIARPRN